MPSGEIATSIPRTRRRLSAVVPAVALALLVTARVDWYEKHLFEIRPYSAFGSALDRAAFLAAGPLSIFMLSAASGDPEGNWPDVARRVSPGVALACVYAFIAFASYRVWQRSGWQRGLAVFLLLTFAYVAAGVLMP